MKIPDIGLGTWDLRGEKCTEVVALALKLGYRHIDTAHVYENHEAVKKGMAGFDRSQLFLTSKLDPESQVDSKNVLESVEKACERALKELGTDYLDLYLIHWPDRDFPIDAVFLVMEKLRKAGKARQVGVSNYTIHHLEDLAKSGGHPEVNQVEFHPYLYQKALLDYCRAHRIQLIAYRPFGKGKLLKAEPLFAKIGAKYGKTGPQVILRWLLQKKIPVIPKASSEKHLRENLDVDFTLTGEDVAQLDRLNQNKRYCGEGEPDLEY
jgi:2,5-diketo-D-gluconate reductase B